MALLTADDLQVRLGSRTVLDGVTCAFTPGSFTGIVGPNGSGKTTLLRALSGVMSPTAGQVCLDGRPIRSLPPRARARQIAVVAQHLADEFDFTAEEVVAMGRYPHLGRWRSEGPTDRTQVQQAMAVTGTADLASRRFSSLSGGERQRVAIARALAQQAQIVLLDEPSNHLDVRHVVSLFDLLTSLNREQGLTVVAVLHDLNLAALYCARLMLLHRGQMVAAGRPAEVLQPEVINRAYGSQVMVTTHPLTGTPQVVLVPAAQPVLPACD